MISYSILIIIMAMILMLICLFTSKEFANRIMCLNCFTSYIIAIIAIIAYIFDKNYLDLAIIYALISFTVTAFLLKIKQGT
jgi:multisubunit Na+/H+ antiporter MnhF subunit